MSNVSINPPKTPVTEGSQGVAAATIPNVCKMPGPPAPFVPAPLPNIGKSGDSPKGFSKSVKIGGKRVAIKGATFGSMGDMASKATGGGLVSANTHGPTKFVGPGSLDVKIEGKSVQLLGDPMLNNCGGSGSPPNAATLVGVLQATGMAAVFGDEDCPLCGKAHGVDGKLEETKETKGAVSDVRAALEAARTVAKAPHTARVAEINATLARLQVEMVGLTKKQRAPINASIKTLESEMRSLSADISAMMGAVKCDCGKIYAGTSFVQYEDVVSRYGHHAPFPYHSLTKPADKKIFSPSRLEDFKSKVSAKYQDKFTDEWRKMDVLSLESREGNTEEMAYPPGTCAAQLMVLLAMDHGCRPVGLSEQWYSSTNSPLSKLKVRDLGADGMPGPSRFAQPEELTGEKPIPPCKTCQVILESLMCTDGKKSRACDHKKPKDGVCFRC